MVMSVESFVSVAEIEIEALKRLPLAIRGYYAGGSGTGSTLRRNTDAYNRYLIRPYTLRDVTYANTTTTILGRKYPFPIGIASTAFHKLANPEGELATVKAAASTNTLMICSTLSTTTLEDIIAEVGRNTSLWYQLYSSKESKITVSMIDRAVTAGYEAIVLTVDTPVLGRRLADKQNSFMLPPPLRLANFDEARNSLGIPVKGESAFETHVQKTFDDALDFEKLEWIVSISKIPVIVKGILREDDALEAIEHGAKAITVSNHGGRQLDFAPSTIECLPRIVRAIKGRCPVFIDGGIRNGGDIFKAIALGADAVFVGRPVLWGLTLAGEQGVKRVLEILREEFLNTMLLAGCRSLDEIRGSKNIVVHENFFATL